jgi:hypothetical protein
MQGRFYRHEEVYLKKLTNKTKKDEISNWIKSVGNFTLSEFGDRFVNSRLIKTYTGSGKWQDILGVLDFDSKANMQAAYKKRWQALNAEISNLLSIPDGEIDLDRSIDMMQKSDKPEIKDLHNRISVLEWAYNYVNLL